jgi:hypothetical protein
LAPAACAKSAKVAPMHKSAAILAGLNLAMRRRRIAAARRLVIIIDLYSSSLRSTARRPARDSRLRTPRFA